MNATTVKIDGRRLADLKRIKQADQSLTALIRELLQAGIRRHRMSEAVSQFADFLVTAPDELEEIDAWATALLEGNRKLQARGARDPRHGGVDRSFGRQPSGNGKAPPCRHRFQFHPKHCAGLGRRGSAVIAASCDSAPSHRVRLPGRRTRALR